MAALRGAVFLAFFASAAAQSTSVTPTEKVISLLEDLKAEVEGEGSSEATAYDAFACFCRDTTSSKSASILSGRDNINTHSSDVELDTATLNDKNTQLSNRQKKDEDMSKELANVQGTYQKERAEYEAEEADLTKAISSLEKAMDSMENSKPGFLQLQKNDADLCKSVSSTLALAEAMGLLTTPKREAVSTFLQNGGRKEDPQLEKGREAYAYHSQGIIDICTQLMADFRKSKSDLDTEWGKTTQAKQKTVSSLNQEISANNGAMGQLRLDIGTLESDIALARENLVTAEGLLKDDEQYLKDLTARCEARGKDWDQRSQLRADEIKALGDALTVLNDDVKPMDEAAGARVLLQRAAVEESPKAAPNSKAALSFLQIVPVKPHQSGSLLERSSTGLSLAQQKEKALDALGQAGKMLNSAPIASLVVKALRMEAAAGADPFAKVKKLIQELVERLINEATSEASKKGFCDTELAKAEHDRKYRHQGVEQLLSDINKLHVHREELDEEKVLLTEQIDALNVDLQNATTLRDNDKTVNLQTIDDGKEGLKAIKKAIDILKVFYKNAGKAKVFLQYSPTEDDTAGAGFSGAYKGKQDSATGIIGLLEVIKSDFERTIRKTTQEEKAAAGEFVEFDRTSQADIGGKSQKKKLDEFDWTSADQSLEQKMSDLQNEQDLLDNALKELEALGPMCVDNTMPYADRVAAREREIEALKQALCALDDPTSPVEEDCPYVPPQ